MMKRIRVLLIAALIAVVCLEVGGEFLPRVTHGFVAAVEAIVGRPLTPVSVAGVARRTARRCSVGVYDC
jgi:hypothetical protein